MSVLTVRDENLAGKSMHEFSLEFLTENVTVRELIRSRIYQEVQDYNVHQGQTEFRGLVTPQDVGRPSHGSPAKARREIDWKEQFNRAIEAFEKKQILILVNDHQVESLDDELAIRVDTVVTFIRLTLLVGG